MITWKRPADDLSNAIVGDEKQDHYPINVYRTLDGDWCFSVVFVSRNVCFPIACSYNVATQSEAEHAAITALRTHIAAEQARLADALAAIIGPASTTGNAS